MTKKSIGPLAIFAVLFLLIALIGAWLKDHEASLMGICLALGLNLAILFQEIFHDHS